MPGPAPGTGEENSPIPGDAVSCELVRALAQAAPGGTGGI